MKKEKETEKPEMEERVIIKGKLKPDGVFVPSSEDVEGLSTRGYGTPVEKGVILDLHEALYLMGEGNLEVADEKTKKKVSFQDLLERSRKLKADAWARYLIYRDLRRRGYVVREGFGFGIDFRAYERGQYGKETADYLIFGIQEGQPLAIEDLARTLDYTQNEKKELILAVLNIRGEVVYYSLSQLTF